MADDYGVLYTDRELSRIEHALSRIYGQASEDIQKQLDDFVKRTLELEQKYQAQVKAGAMTQEAFDKWKAGRLLGGQQIQDKYKQVALILANTNTAATNLIRDRQLLAFGVNANWTAYEFEHGFGTGFGFDLYDQKTVARLIRDNPNILPFKKLDKKKDMKWNFKNIRSQVTQGILQGESIPEIAKRLASVVPNRNEKQMILHARTSMTAAQNGGRMERYKEAEELGIKFKKVWLATLDGRTRDLHADLDGQAVLPDEDFEIDGFAVQYPGDPLGEPEMVYNCRCTMTTELIDYPSRFDRSSGKNPEFMTYRQWEESKREHQGYVPDQSYYQDLSGFGYNQETTQVLNDRFKMLDSMYGARISDITTTLKDAQEEYDLYYQNYVNHLLEENPRMRRSTAEKRAVEVLGQRPEEGRLNLDFITTGGNFNMETRRMTLNPDGLQSNISIQSDIDHHRRYVERMEKKKARGAEIYPDGNVVYSVEGSFIHEYGHAIDAQFGIHDNPKFIEFYSRYSDSDISFAVSEYATADKMEFIAECFAQSFMGEYQSEMSKGFMQVLGEIINDYAK